MGNRWLRETKREIQQGAPPPRKTRRRPGRPWKKATLLREAISHEVRPHLAPEDALPVVENEDGACFDCRATREAVPATRNRHELPHGLALDRETKLLKEG
jgi:hypothetical protein